MRVSNAIYQIALTFFNLLLPVLIYPFLFRLFGPNEIGFFFYIDAIVGIFVVFGNFGIATYGYREISKISDIVGRKKIVSELLAFGAITNFIFFAIYCLFALLNFSNQRLLIAIILGSRIFVNIINLDWVFQGLQRFKFITLRVIFLRLLFVLCIFLFIDKSNGIILFSWLTFLYFLFESSITFYALWRERLIKFESLFSGWGEKRKTILPLALVLLMSNLFLLFNVFDKLILGYLGKTQEVAYYKLSEGLIAAIYQVLVSFAFVSIPLLVRDYYSKSLNFIKKISQLYSLMMFLAIPISVGLIVLQNEIVLLYAGGAYKPAALTLKWNAVYLVLMVIQGLFSSQILFVIKREIVIVKYFLIFGVISILLKIMFIKILNSALIMLLTSISFFLLTSMIIFHVFKKEKIVISIFNLDIFSYLIISLSFFSIKNFVFTLNISLGVQLVLVVFFSAIFYLFANLIRRDKNLNYLFFKESKNVK